LGLAQTEEDQSGAQSFVDVLNPWLGVEMAMVRDSGEAKMLLDTDIVTVVGKKSANVSVVPLVDGETQQGFLILIEDISQGKRLEGAMRRFMTQKIVDQVMARDDGLMFGSAVQASVLFADIRNFTSMTESLGPRQTVDMLNSVFSDLYDAVSEADGVLDKFIGDAVMAVYGAPLPGSNDAGNAVASALRMQSMIREINARRAGEGQPPIGLGIGIATGEVVAGTIGSPKRMDYTVIGDSVNLAARLQDLTKLYGLGLIVCEETAAANGGALLREIDLIRVRGRKRPARIFEILPDGSAPAWHLDYQLGRERLAGRDWEGAIAAFDAVLAACGEDGPTILMRARAQSAMRIPPPADWDGVW
jgi:adenylate cyclase